jgi:hypothetical protein
MQVCWKIGRVPQLPSEFCNCLGNFAIGNCQGNFATFSKICLSFFEKRQLHNSLGIMGKWCFAVGIMGKSRFAVGIMGKSRFAVGIMGTFFFVGIVGKSRFSSFLTLLSEFWEPPGKFEDFENHFRIK